MECRICFGDERPDTMMIPCRCRGTSAYVHDHCLRTYFLYYPDRICRVCFERMGHPWMDLERNFVCAVLVLVWAAVLLALSTVSFAAKVLAFGGLTSLLIFHIRRQQLTYELTLSCIALSGLFFASDPVYLPQTVFLATGLVVILSLYAFIPMETVFVIMVFFLALTYSILLTLAVSLKTDPGFTGTFFFTMIVFWFLFLRPGRRNDVYA